MPVPIDYSQILFDASGKPYWRDANGGKVYLPPLAAAQSPDLRAREWARSMGVSIGTDGQVTNESAPGASFAKERGHWDAETGTWKQDTDWANIITTGLAAVPLGAAGVELLTGGGGAAAGPGTGAGGATGGGAATLPPAAAGGGSALSKILSPKGALDIAGLIPSIASLFRGNTSGPFGGGPNADALTQQIQDSLASQQRRFDATEPAFNTAQNMAIGMAPTRYRSGPFGGSR